MVWYGAVWYVQQGIAGYTGYDPGTTSGMQTRPGGSGVMAVIQVYWGVQALLYYTSYYILHLYSTNAVILLYYCNMYYLL